MPKTRTVLFFMLCSITMGLMQCGRPPQKYYRIISRWTKEEMQLTPADFDGDGVDELVQVSGGQLDVVDQSLRRFYRSFGMTDYEQFWAAPIEGASLDSVAFFIFSKTRDSCFCDLLSHIKRNNREQRITYPLYRFPRLLRPNIDHFDQGVAYLGKRDTTANSPLLLKLNTPRNVQYKRGFILLDPVSKSELWQFEMGPQVRSPRFTNVDTDAAPELIFGSYAPDNGVEWNGTCDDSCYAFCLDDNGTLLWRKPLGGRFSGVLTYPGRFRPTGHQVAVITFSVSSSKSTTESISILDAATGELVEGPRSYGDRIPENPDLFFSPVCDMDKNGMADIVLGNTDGYVRIIDNNLNLKHISDNYGTEIQVKAIVDMNGDGLNEVVCVLPYDKLLILDHTLQEMTSFPLKGGSKTNLFAVRNGYATRLLLFTPLDFSTGAINLWNLLELNESSFPFETYTGAAKYFWWSLGGFALIGVLSISLYSRRRLFMPIFLKLLRQTKMLDGTLLLTKRGKIRAAGTLWLQLVDMPAELIAGRKLSELDPIPDVIRSNLQNSLQKKANSNFRLILDKSGHKTPVLVEVEYIKLLGLYQATLHYTSQEKFVANFENWAGAAQKLAHGIKNPLTSMKLNLDELDAHLKEEVADQEIMEHVTSIHSQIERLRRMADGFTRFIEFNDPDLSAVSVNEFIEKCIAQLKDDLPANVNLSLDLGPALPLALINAEQLQYAFENVLFNAAQSIKDHGTVIVQTQFLQRIDKESKEAQDYVEIRIQDNGTGIDPDLLHRVTDPYFTTKKEGTGLGLSLVVQIMKLHGGEFDIQSKPGEGTIAFLRLRAVP